jgi:hypothetical protein
MRIPYGLVQGSGYNTCTGKYCIICPGGTKKKKNQFQDQQIKILYTDNTNFFKNLNTQTSLKLKTNLIRPIRKFISI